MSLHIDCEMIVHLFSKWFYFLKFSNHFISATKIFFLICLQICIHDGKLLFVWIVSVFCTQFALAVCFHTHTCTGFHYSALYQQYCLQRSSVCVWGFCVESPRSHGITVNLVPVPAVLPWSWSPSPRCYRKLRRHYRGVTAVTAGKPWSPSLCSCLLWSWRKCQ